MLHLCQILSLILCIVPACHPTTFFRQSNAYSTDFCRYRCVMRMNICCIYRGRHNMGRNCKGRMKVIQLYEEDKNLILNAFNGIRNLTAGGESPRESLHGVYASNMHILSYSKQLEFTAACWAKQCYIGHSRCKANEFGTLGETICWKRSVPQAVGNVYKRLLRECPFWHIHNYPELRIGVIDTVTFPVVGNDERNRESTQIIWADSQFVGCFVVNYPDMTKLMRITLVVCHFSPAGNKAGQSVFIRGKPCSDCAVDETCNVRYKNLCGTIRPQKEDLWIPPLNDAREFAAKNVLYAFFSMHMLYILWRIP